MSTKYRPAHQNADREGIKIITQNGMAKRNKLRSIVHCLAMCNSSILNALRHILVYICARSRLQFEITNERAVLTAYKRGKVQRGPLERCAAPKPTRGADVWKQFIISRRVLNYLLLARACFFA